MKQCRGCKVYFDVSRTACRRCGEGTLEETQLLVDGRYEVERELGRGGMGVVFLARDLGLDRKVALKVITPAFARDAFVLQRFRREAATLAAIRHDHVVQVYALGTAPQPFFAMEYVRGMSLGAIVQEHWRAGDAVPVRRALTIIRQIASALDAVHAAGILHRDVKPDNVVIEDDSGRPVLIDFGLVTESARQICGPRGYGTPQYMPPEQGPHAVDRGLTEVTKSADVYSLACTAYELLCGAVPFDADANESVFRSHAYDPVPQISRLRPELAPFDAVFDRALRKQPGERFTSAGDFAHALDRAGASWCVVAAPLAVRTIAPPAPRDAVRVLVVDDDDDFRRYAGRAAQLAFYQRPIVVTQARSGQEAIRAIAREPPQLVLLDYSMPGLNGVETLSIVREMRGGADARVIVVSANAREEQRCAFSLLGVSDFAEKPVGLKALVELIAGIGRRSGWMNASDPVAPLLRKSAAG